MRQFILQSIYGRSISFSPLDFMKIISWNVCFENKKILKGLDYIFSLEPDVICLQELPQSILDHLIKTQKNHYYINYAHDFSSVKKAKNSYICTLTLKKPIASTVIKYGQVIPNSLLNKFFYRFIKKVTEQHLTLQVDLKIKGRILPVLNTRLSCAVSPQFKLSFLQKIFKALKKSKNERAIFCGDFNINDNLLFSLLTGWTRGYRFKDYFYKERKLADAFFKEKVLQNIFQNRTTTCFKIPGLQLDHILIPCDTKIITHKLLARFGSDHYILFLKTDQ